MLNSSLRRWALGLLVALLGAGVTITIVDNGRDSEPGTARRTIIVHVDGRDRDAKRDDAIRLDPSAQAGLKRAENGETAKELDEPLKQPGDRPQTIPGPLAADEVPGCRTAFVRNQSRRTGGQLPRVIVWHQTVSRENGWSSQNALTAYANRPSSGVSWHLLIGRSGGRCTYSVPLLQKAWAQSNANSFSIGIEVEAYGDEGAYVVGAGKAKLLAVTRYLGRRFGIPMRNAIVRNCQPITSGILEHKELGVCGGGHIDVTLTTSIQELALIREVAQTARATVTVVDRTTCRKINWWRTHGRLRGKPEANAVRRKRALARRGVTCTARGPVRP